MDFEQRYVQISLLKLFALILYTLEGEPTVVEGEPTAAKLVGSHPFVYKP